MQDKNYQLKHAPIFVCGVQRAGTTLLVKMLSKGEQVSFLPQETHLFPLLWKRDGQISSFDNSKELSEFLKINLPKVNYGWTTATEFLNEVCEEIIQQAFMPNSTEDLLEFILRLWEVKQGEKVHAGEKTPAHIYYALKKLKKFPKTKIVLMCRDPRAAALSELKKLENNKRINKNFNAFTFIVRWATAVTLAKQLSKRKDVIFIRYEDLILAPQKSLKSVTDFLEINYNDSMLDVGVTNSSFQDSEQKGIQFNSKNLTRWESELPSAIIKLIEYHLKSEMENLGYEIDQNGKPSQSAITLLKQKTKLIAAKQMVKVTPALFHHLNRNKKYRNLRSF